MDPTSAGDQYKKVQTRGQEIVGWYHSHPKFEVNPSHIDVMNHEMYQKMFNESSLPFVALIISPYFQDITTKQNGLCKLKCFITQVDRASGKIKPYEIALNILP